MAIDSTTPVSTIAFNGVEIPISSVEQIQTDWNQIDESAVDFIKNKPCYSIETTATIETTEYGYRISTLSSTGDIDEIFLNVAINNDGHGSAFGYSGSLKRDPRDERAFTGQLIGDEDILHVYLFPVTGYFDATITSENRDINSISIHSIRYIKLLDKELLPNDIGGITVITETEIPGDSEVSYELFEKYASGFYILKALLSFEYIYSDPEVTYWAELNGFIRIDNQSDNGCIYLHSYDYGTIIVLYDDGAVEGYPLPIIESTVMDYADQVIVPEFRDVLEGAGLLQLNEEDGYDLVNVNDIIDDKISEVLGHVESTLQSIYGGVL